MFSLNCIEFRFTDNIQHYLNGKGLQRCELEIFSPKEKDVVTWWLARWMPVRDVYLSSVRGHSVVLGKT